MFFKKNDTDKNIKQQSKISFNGIHKSYKNCDSYTYKQNEVLMDKPIYLGFAILELNKLLMYGRYYDKLQLCFRQEKFRLLYMDTDTFLFSVKTKDNIKDKILGRFIFDFSNLDKNHELYSNKNKRLIGFFKIETPKNIWIDEFVYIRCKMYAFKCGDDSKTKLKGITESQSKHIKFEEYKKCLEGKQYQIECNNSII